MAPRTPPPSQSCVRLSEKLDTRQAPWVSQRKEDKATQRQRTKRRVVLCKMFCAATAAMLHDTLPSTPVSSQRQGPVPAEWARTRRSYQQQSALSATSNSPNASHRARDASNLVAMAST